MTDAFSKCKKVVALPNQTAETTCRALMDKIVLYHGPPSNFTSRILNILCQELKTKHKTTTAYHPQSNEMTERFNKTMVEIIGKYIAKRFEHCEDRSHRWLLPIGIPSTLLQWRALIFLLPHEIQTWRSKGFNSQKRN